MDYQAPPAFSTSAPTPESGPRLVAVITDHNIDHALRDMEQTFTRLRADADQANGARAVLRTPVEVLRTTLRLRAARVEPSR